MATISVIIPTYNRSRLLQRCLISVFSQLRQADEILVVDDGSTDDTSFLIREQFPSVKYLRQENRGVSAARNAGIACAQGDWIAFLDSDDEWLPDKLEKQVLALEQNPEHRVIHTNELWLYRGEQKNQKLKHRKYGGLIFQKCLPLCVISPSSVLIHKSIFDEVGLFDESLPACEDYDLWLRITARYPVLFIDEELIIKHGGHEDQLSQKYWGMDRFRIKAIHNILQSDVLDGENRDAAIEAMLKKIDIYLKGAEKHKNTNNISEFNLILDDYSKNIFQ